MPEEALSRARSFIAGSIRSRRADLPLREPVDSFSQKCCPNFPRSSSAVDCHSGKCGISHKTEID